MCRLTFTKKDLKQNEKQAARQRRQAVQK